MTLHFYFARRFLVRVVMVFAAFFVITYLSDASSIVGQLGEAGVGMAETLRLALLKTPNGVYQLKPIIIVLAALALFMGLNRGSELVASRASGLSRMRIIAAPVLAALIVGMIGVAVLNPLAAGALRRFETETGRYKSGALSSFSLTRKGLWLRQGDSHGQTVIFAERANFTATRLTGVTFFVFDAEGVPQQRIEAAFAILGDGFWTLGDGRLWQVDAGDRVPDRTARSFSELRIESELTSDEILDSFGDPTTIPIWNLPAFITRLERSGLAAERHRAYLQIELASPVLLAAMVMIGAAFTMRHGRFARGGLMVLYAVISGLGVFIVQNFAQILGANGAVPALAAAWGPPLAAILFALGMILRSGDG